MGEHWILKDIDHGLEMHVLDEWMDAERFHLNAFQELGDCHASPLSRQKRCT